MSTAMEPVAEVVSWSADGSVRIFWHWRSSNADIGMKLYAAPPVQPSLIEHFRALTPERQEQFLKELKS